MSLCNSSLIEYLVARFRKWIRLVDCPAIKTNHCEIMIQKQFYSINFDDGPSLMALSMVTIKYVLITGTHFLSCDNMCILLYYLSGTSISGRTTFMRDHLCRMAKKEILNGKLLSALRNSLLLPTSSWRCKLIWFNAFHHLNGIICCLFVLTNYFD